MDTFSKSAILHRFPNFYTLSVEIFRMFFMRSRLRMNAMNHEKFHENRSAVSTFSRNPEDRHIDRRGGQTDAAAIYTYRVCKHSFVIQIVPKNSEKNCYGTATPPSSTAKVCKLQT